MKYDQIEDHDPMDSLDEQSNDPMLPREPQKRQIRRGLHLSPTCLLVYCSILMTAIIICLAVIVTQLHRNSTQCLANADDDTFRGKYGRDPHYMSLEHRYDGLWEDLEGESAVFNLSDPTRNGEELPASISMFHQLHCISSLRHAIQQAREGVDPGKDWRDNAHWPHCMDYLRKTILCWADGTIERQPLFRNGTKAPFIDGSHDDRQCGDSAKLIQIMNDHGKRVRTEPFP